MFVSFTKNVFYAKKDTGKGIHKDTGTDIHRNTFQNRVDLCKVFVVLFEAAFYM